MWSDATGPGVVGWAVVGRVVLAKEYKLYIVKKTLHSNGGCHWADAIGRV
jgi:hypothetical protein